jgi:predicted Zn finger-like uncharacterized protein
MQIVCPSCTTSYDLAPTALGDTGRSVRCARCRNVWFATPTAEPVETPVAAVAGDQSASAVPAADEALPGPGAPPDEFEWSLEQTAVENGAGEPAKAPDPATDTNAAQDSIDAVWSAAETPAVAEAEAPSLVPALEGDKSAKPEPHAAEPHPEPHPTPENIETVAARLAQRHAGRRRWKLPQWKLPRWKLLRRKPTLAWPGMPATIVALALTVAGLVISRSDVVRALPQTASLFSAVGLPVNLRGLVFENVKTTGELHEGVPVLIIEGTIANVAGKSVEVPRLRFAMRNRAGHEVYAWTSVTGRSILAAGETAAFRTRLASPPADGRDVIVRFFNRRDFLAGMR